MHTRYRRRALLQGALATAVAAGFSAAAPERASAARATGHPGTGPTIPEVPGMRGDPRANEFWYQYDDRFLYNQLPEIREAFQQIMAVIGQVEGGFYGAWAASRAAGSYPASYIEAVAPVREPLAVVSRYQLALIDEFYRWDPRGLVSAFIDFGQGVLYDPRRPEGQKVHLMDYTNDVEPPGGYHVWHSINRAMMLLDIDALRWRLIDPLVGLTWAVQSIAKPAMDSPDNPRLDPRLLLRLQLQWLPRTPTQLDTAFDSIPYPVGIS